MKTNEPPATRVPAESQPRAEIKGPARFSVIWVVPLVAALLAGYLVYKRVNDVGPRIKIRFKDGSGLKPGQTPVKYRGVTVGEVRAIALTSDQQQAEVEVRLVKSAQGIAREGSVFWIVRPEVGVGNITGLGTIISGAYIEVLPGAGEAKKKFDGAQASPVAREEKGLKVMLVSPRRGSLKAGSPVYYRGIEVGAVQEHRLSLDARSVEAEVFIQRRYVPLVRAGSKFWNASGLEFDFSLFKGAQLNVESLKSLVSGGVSFATPDGGKDNEPARDGTVFRLYEEPKKEWLEWSPAIEIPVEK